jgi:phycocyanobilin:ferredoxin oxidoreductase
MHASAEAVSLPDLMRGIAHQFVVALQHEPGAQSEPAPVLPAHPGLLHWQNWIFSSDRLRRAHVELFEIEDQFAVVHVCLLPRLHIAYPIFGFDMIAGPSRATGLFLDFSPVMPGLPVPALNDALTEKARCQFSHRRELPDWGGIFSPDFFAVRPNSSSETEAGLDLARSAFGFYLRHLQRTGCTVPSEGENPLVVQGQTAYALGQRKNEHTCRMLARFVGAEAARAFVHDILFPLPVERSPHPA